MYNAEKLPHTLSMVTKQMILGGGGMCCCFACNPFRVVRNVCVVHTESKSHLSVLQWLSDEVQLENAAAIAAVFGNGTNVLQLVRALDIKSDTSIMHIANEVEDILSKHREHQSQQGETNPIQLPPPFLIRKVAAELREIASHQNSLKTHAPSHGSGAPETMVR